ncbi:MAG TPA: Ig-like domain-containing protein, partial [Candidatus Paceibacterota bacterium]|nr:Ig-like domain-containing protein [Candidatus Paceibacterota bacterium]
MVPLFVLGAGALDAFAATNQFTIGLTVVGDVTPPTIPGGLSATPVSGTQIDLSWTASTDDVAVAGYVVYRDGSPLATTTSTTYSSTGLTPLTGYAYFVQAFDASLNYSGNSATVNATTTAGGGGGPPPDLIPPTVTALSPANGATGVATGTALQITFSELIRKKSGNITIHRQSDGVAIDTIDVAGVQVSLAGTVATITLTAPLTGNTTYYVLAPAGTFDDQGGNNFAGILTSSDWVFATVDTTAPVISGIGTVTTYTTATTSFSTNEPALATYAYGTTTDYGLGTISEFGYSTTHAFFLSGLATSTQYYFRVTAKDTSNNTSAPVTGTFTTNTPPPPPDTTPPANPSNLTATPGLTSIALSWVNPVDADFAAVRIVRKLGGFPADPNDGVLVYDGGGQSTTDTGLTEGTTYFYTAFARDLTGNYSSGSIVSATTDTSEPPPPPPPPPPGGEDEPPPTGGGTTTPPVVPPPIIPDIFPDFPATGTPDVGFLKLSLNDFDFTELGTEERLLPIRSGVVRVDSEKNLRISIDSAKVPNVFKTITFTIAHPTDPEKRSSLLLRSNPRRGTYETILAPLGERGMYPFVIDMLDHENKGRVDLRGSLDVFESDRAFTIPIPKEITELVTETVRQIEEPVRAVSPVAIPVGVTVGASQAILLATNASSFYDLYLLFLKLIGVLTGLFRRKRNEPWGVVYDSVTKRPLDPAYVIAQIRDQQKSSGEAITDLDGRYGFILNPGEYIIQANKTHYKFPSEKLKGRGRDELYENLYFGDPFQVREGSVIQYNIPLDPVEFDWNEFAKNQDKVFKVYSRRDRFRLWLFSFVF